MKTEILKRPMLGTPDWNGEGTVLLVDKPLDWTSFDVVKKIRSLFRVRKIGHAGTLDPMASGLLIVCTGPKTKVVERFSALSKVYRGTFELGIVTPSFDAETEIEARKDPSHVTLDDLHSAARTFLGVQMQTPPMYSAVKYAGRPLYTYARKGKTVERTPKEVEVMEFSIVEYRPPMAEFHVLCSKGTYIRSLVNDLGQVLGCGATLRSLRRTAIGEFDVEDAFRIEDLTALRDKESVSGKSHARRATAS